MFDNINNFLDQNGKIKSWPSKRSKKTAILYYLSGKFEIDRKYSEREVNAVIEQWHTFNDLFILRRGMVDTGFLSRTADGSRYWRENVAPDTIT